MPGVRRVPCARRRPRPASRPGSASRLRAHSRHDGKHLRRAVPASAPALRCQRGDARDGEPRRFARNGQNGWGSIEHRKSNHPECRGCRTGRRQHPPSRFGEAARGLRGVWEPWHAPKLSTGTREASVSPRALSRGRRRKGIPAALDARHRGVGLGHGSDEIRERKGLRHPRRSGWSEGPGPTEEQGGKALAERGIRHGV